MTYIYLYVYTVGIYLYLYFIFVNACRLHDYIINYIIRFRDLVYH